MIEHDGSNPFTDAFRCDKHMLPPESFTDGNAGYFDIFGKLDKGVIPCDKASILANKDIVILNIGWG